MKLKNKIVGTEESDNYLNCPDCGGDGIVIGVRTVAVCCGSIINNGECCGYSVPEQEQEPEQCNRCEATGKIGRT